MRLCNLQDFRWRENDGFLHALSIDKEINFPLQPLSLTMNSIHIALKWLGLLKTTANENASYKTGNYSAWKEKREERKRIQLQQTNTHKKNTKEKPNKQEYKRKNPGPTNSN